MIMEISRLIRIDFDTMENHAGAAISSKCLGTFAAGDGITAHGKLGNWLAAQPPVKMYAGWDGRVYPQFRIEDETVM